jgi:hypothetical protein
VHCGVKTLLQEKLNKVTSSPKLSVKNQNGVNLENNKNKRLFQFFSEKDKLKMKVADPTLS